MATTQQQGLSVEAAKRAVIQYLQVTVGGTTLSGISGFMPYEYRRLGKSPALEAESQELADIVLEAVTELIAEGKLKLSHVFVRNSTKSPYGNSPERGERVFSVEPVERKFPQRDNLQTTTDSKV
jgi:hypothetical protein